ncbi:MAG: hypothetical protein U0174_05355 [Polyangiaceae bacterium]
MSETSDKDRSSAKLARARGPSEPHREELKSIDLTEELDEDLSEPAIDVDDDSLVEIPPDSFSVDNLLALTGEEDAFDIDEHARSLKKAAGPKKKEPPAPRRPPTVAIPTPFDLGARRPQAELSPTPIALALLEGDEVRVSRSAPPPPRRPDGKPSQGPPPLTIKRPKPPLSEGSPTGFSTVEGGAATEVMDLLLARIAVLETTEDPVGLSRAHLELAIAGELVGDDVRVDAHLAAALKVNPNMQVAHGIVRRRLHGRTALPGMISHLDKELAHATVDASVIGLIAERARLLDAQGESTEEIARAWERVLQKSPHHSAALKGLEVQYLRALDPMAPETYEVYANHLSRMADAYGAQPDLAAWLHTERARILERVLGRTEEARGALERALELDPGIGPVRSHVVRFLGAHDDAVTLCRMLDQEALLEGRGARSAQLELDAACIAKDRLKDDARAIQLLERAAGRAPTSPLVDRRVQDELVAMYESSSQWRDAIRARRTRLTMLTDQGQVGYELRKLASIAERIGDFDSAIADLKHAAALAPDDETLTETLDRLLARTERHPERLELWLEESERLKDSASKSAKALLRAAKVAEQIDDQEEALSHLTAARQRAPGDSEAVDELARLLTPAPSERLDTEVRSLIDLYAQAAMKAPDPARKVAYLEKTALFWEDVLGEPRRAARIYEEILLLDPGRRNAILGLHRTGAKAGDAKAVAAALLEEANQTTEDRESAALRIRAAQTLATVDPSRAITLVTSVLTKDEANHEARVLETRLHEDAGRFTLAAESLRARIDLAHTRTEKVKLWLALAHVQESQLQAPEEALASLKAARALDPSHLVPPAEIARILTELGDYSALRTALEGLAQNAQTPDERAMYLLRAGEIEELRGGDDAAAAKLYVQALTEAPHDDLIGDRLDRVLCRRSRKALDQDASLRGQGVGLGERITLLGKRLERTTGPERDRSRHRVLSLELADLLMEVGQDIPRATSLLESVLSQDPASVPALRSLEVLLRRSGEWARLAQVLSLQGQNFVDARARMGSLWALAAIEEWRLESNEDSDTYRRILSLDPTDPSALEAMLRRSYFHARRGDIAARDQVIAALRAFTALSSDDSGRLIGEVQLALILESWGQGHAELLREALERYRVALALDTESVTAATGLARLANRLNDVPGAVAAAISLASLSRQKPNARARYLHDAASLLLSDSADEHLGSLKARGDRAALLLEEAIDIDPDSVPVAASLATLRQSRGEHLALVDSLRSTLLKATSPDAIVMLGTEIAAVARDELRNLPIAIEAMQKVRQTAPKHTPSLLTLSELYIAARQWDAATEVLETVASPEHDAQARLTALFALARIYEKITKSLKDAERTLRVAVELDPDGPRAIRALLRRLANKAHEPAEEGDTKDHRGEMADLLERLANVERDVATKTDVLLELADMRVQLSETGHAERALIEAIAISPDNAVAFTKLARLFKSDPTSYARALLQVVARGKERGISNARWLATLGHIEIDKLGRVREGVSHLKQAIALDDTLYEYRFELASALARMGSNEEACRTLFDMLKPDPKPLLSVADPAAALDLLERTLNAERRPEEAIVLSELRAITGDLDEGRQTWLRDRRLPQLDVHHTPFDRTFLIGNVLPKPAAHVLLDVAAAVSGLESRVLRADLTDLGIASRDRVRGAHPTRALLDRVARALSVTGIELVVTPTVNRTRVLIQDEPWVVVPQKLLDLPEPTQLASMARAVAKIAFSVPWLEELPPPHIEAYLVACARLVAPNYGREDIDVISARLVSQYEPLVSKNISRKQRKALEELVPRLASSEARLIPIEALTGALAHAELRTAYLVTGDLLATIDELRGMDAKFLKATASPGRAALTAVLGHRFAGDVSRFALTPEATALRRRVGATWAG